MTTMRQSGSSGAPRINTSSHLHEWPARKLAGKQENTSQRLAGAQGALAVTQIPQAHPQQISASSCEASSPARQPVRQRCPPALAGFCTSACRTQPFRTAMPPSASQRLPAPCHMCPSVGWWSPWHCVHLRLGQKRLDFEPQHGRPRTADRVHLGAPGPGQDPGQDPGPHMGVVGPPPALVAAHSYAQYMHMRTRLLHGKAPRGAQTIETRLPVFVLFVFFPPQHQAFTARMSSFGSV